MCIDLPSDVSVICYTGETLVLTADMIAQVIETVVIKNRHLGPEVVLHKSKVMSFYSHPSGSRITAGGVIIGVESTMKY